MKDIEKWIREEVGIGMMTISSEHLAILLEKYSSEQCQKRDELIKAQDEYIEHLKLCSYHGFNILFDNYEPKIEQLKKEIQ